MKNKSRLAAVALGIFALSLGPAFAASWKETSDKGLAIYTLGSPSSGQIKLVCDPDGVWADGPSSSGSQFYMLASVNNHPVTADSIEIKTESGTGGTLKSPGGAAALASLNKPVWNKLIKALSGASSITVKSGSQQFSINTSNKTALRCLTGNS